jgi:ectoine hydroxylase-related dioxygenase (phytanoyl-CoA dioxygenase family)
VVAATVLDELAAVVEAGRSSPLPPLAASLEQGVPVYDMSAPPTDSAALGAEWVNVLLHGAGIIAVRHAFDDLGVIDRATSTFFEIIAEQQTSGAAAGDHFAPPGANDRVWNALQKLALRDAETFVAYYSNLTIALICHAWLGPGYQVTSQVNVVNPGGHAQSPHCDYHLGFMSNQQAGAYPAHVHSLSPTLTLQGAIAHCDMPVESGPTLYLPHSHKHRGVYLSWRDGEVVEYFQEHLVQLPLSKGDAVFFNPSVLHAAGSNRTADIRRVANLLQVSSAFGRPMESVDRLAMCEAVYGSLLAMPDRAACERALAACAEGYAFPTNIDRDPPIDGLAPPTQADLMRQALRERWSTARLSAELGEHRLRRLP